MNLEQELIAEAQAQGINRYVVGAVIFWNSKVLLLERPKDDFMGGIYELPSGKVEAGEALYSALSREIEEETGLKVDQEMNYLGCFEYESKSGQKTRQFNFTVTVQSPAKITLREHSHYTWVAPDDLDRYPVTDRVKGTIQLGVGTVTQTG